MLHAGPPYLYLQWLITNHQLRWIATFISRLERQDFNAGAGQALPSAERGEAKAEGTGRQTAPIWRASAGDCSQKQAWRGRDISQLFTFSWQKYWDFLLYMATWLPLAKTVWVRSTFKSYFHCPLYYECKRRQKGAITTRWRYWSRMISWIVLVNLKKNCTV